jgi:hypothetical protein
MGILMAKKKVEILTAEMKDELMKSFHDAGDIWRASEVDAIKFYFRAEQSASKRLGVMLRGARQILVKATYIDNLYRKVNLPNPKRYKVYNMATDADTILASNKKSFITVKKFNKSPYQAIMVHNEIQRAMDYLFANFDLPEITCGFFVDTSRLTEMDYMYAHAHGMAIEIKMNEDMPKPRELYRALVRSGINLVMFNRFNYVTLMATKGTIPRRNYHRCTNGNRRFTNYSILEAYQRPFTWSRAGAVF